MYLKNIIQYICTKNTESENTNITVIKLGKNKVIWDGKAKDMQNVDVLNQHWIVVEILVDYEDKNHQAVYNKNKVITVV